MVTMELTAAEAWSRILEHARPVLEEHNFRRWLDHTDALNFSGEVLTVAARDEFAADWLQTKYGQALETVAARVLGGRPSIRFRHHPSVVEVVSPPTEVRVGAGDRPVPGYGSGAVGNRTPMEEADRSSQPAAPAAGPALNERYTFDRFVVGVNNEFAAASCRAVAQSPARRYNPLFIYGGVGLGKTHLMHAIGNAVLAREPDARVTYVSSEQFTNDLISAIQTGRTEQFRRRYRQIDLLLLDDVHFLGEKERTQEEFFHTFNAIYDARGQIVLTSDRAPKEIPGLEDRLVNRFEWGLVTDIRPPDYETRSAILAKKAEEDRIILDPEVIDFVARNCRNSVRELEGAMIKLLAFASLTRREIDLALAREALGSTLARGRPIILSPESIRDRVAESWGVSVDALVSKKRTKEITVPRQVAMYMIRELLERPLTQIGHYFGGRDHSTVIHAVSKVREQLETDEKLRSRVDRLRNELAP